MFEDSVLRDGPGGTSRARQWTIAASVAIQGLVLTAFLMGPLLWPAVLPVVSAAPRVTPIVLRTAEPKHEPVKRHVVTNTNAQAVSAPANQVASVVTERRGGVLSRVKSGALEEEAPSFLMAGPGVGMGSPRLPGGGFGPGSAERTVVAAAPRASGPVRVSSGVSAGLLLTPIRPTYPAIAKAAHVEGTVVVTAVIDKDGHITGLQVVSGPAMLRSAAVEAIQAARYKPFQLNGAATEVVTTVSVVFQMEGRG